MPIKTRIDNVWQQHKTPVGIRFAGPDHKVIQDIGLQFRENLKQSKAQHSVYSERVAGGSLCQH